MLSISECGQNECDTVNLQTLLHRETVEMKIKNSQNDQQDKENPFKCCSYRKRGKESACLEVRIM